MANDYISQQTQYNKQNDIQLFSKVLRHELKNPLNVIKLNLTIIKKRYKSNTHELYSALDAINYIDNILNYYKSILCEEKIHYENFYLKHELKEIKKFLKPKLDKFNLKLIIKSLNYNLKGSKTSFKQLLLNLINNSVEAYNKTNYSNTQPIIINGNDKNNFYLIDVIDYGIGINSKYKDKIFTAFFTSKKNTENLGLGLNICSNILKRDFNGKLELVSCKNPTIFRIKLPKWN